ncbi:Uncharacterised protein r2_g1698 [Pycnogonum litorale]
MDDSGIVERSSMEYRHARCRCDFHRRNPIVRIRVLTAARNASQTCAMFPEHSGVFDTPIEHTYTIEMFCRYSLHRHALVEPSHLARRRSGDRPTLVSKKSLGRRNGERRTTGDVRQL